MPIQYNEADHHVLRQAIFIDLRPLKTSNIDRLPYTVLPSLGFHTCHISISSNFSVPLILKNHYLVQHEVLAHHRLTFARPGSRPRCSSRRSSKERALECPYQCKLTGSEPRQKRFGWGAFADYDDQLEHPPSDGTHHCGNNDYDAHDICLSAQRGIQLKIAGKTRGKNSYPHSFENDDSKGNKLSFPSWCPADTSRYEFPLMNPVYDGGKNNVKQGDERVVYYWVPGDIDYEGNPNVQYCGIMTHVGAPSGGFLLC